jgi:hypothetical protein
MAMNQVRMCALTAGMAALAVGLVFSGCGMPGAPLPPSLNLADPVKDLAATRAGNQVSLTWTMPQKNTDKLLLKGNLEVRVCRREGATGTCAPAGDLRLAPKAEGKFTDTLPAALTAGEPRKLTYFVEVMNGNGRSAGLSNAGVVLAGEAPRPVIGLKAEVRKQGVVLRWNSVADEPTATAIRLHRKLLTPPVPAKKEAGQKSPLAPAPEPTELNLLVEASGGGGGFAGRALDKDVRFGETYEYRAQRVARVTVDGQTKELDGPLSEPIEVGVLDVFPPAVPTGLAAVAIAAENGGEAAIDLSWQPDSETDLAGSIVYRREGSGEWRRISPALPVVGPAFHDAHVQAGRSYNYAVSAVDEGGHESGRSSEAEETVPGP